MVSLGRVTKGVGAISELAFGQVSMSHRFIVHIDRSLFDLGSWSKVSGLTVKWARLSHRAGTDNDAMVRPGNVSYSDIRLSRAACSDSATVQEWLAETSRAHAPLSGAVQMLDFTGLPLITWELKQFFPISWSISDFDSGSARPAVETLDLAHTGFLHDEAAIR